MSSLEDAVRRYLAFSDRHRGDDYFDGDRRAVRMTVDMELERGDRLRAAAEALVRKRFDWFFDDEEDSLEDEYNALLDALGMTAEEIAAPGRAKSEAADAARRAKDAAELARRVALTQEERDAEDAAWWASMDFDQQQQFIVRGFMYRPGEEFRPFGSKGSLHGSWRIRTAEEIRASWCPPYHCLSCGAFGKEPCARDCSAAAADRDRIAELEAERAKDVR